MDNEAKTKPMTHWGSLAAGRAEAVRRYKFGLLAIFLIVCPRLSFGQTALITGGADASGHHYEWQVHNTGTSPIVEVSFPHYPSGIFLPPKGWSSDCAASVQLGGKDGPVVCTARAIVFADAIAPGRSLTLSMQIPSVGARRGPSEVTVRFADGSKARIPGVEVPQPEAAGDKNLPLLGLGSVFVIFIIAQAVRKRRRRARQGDEWRAEETGSH